jgi:PRC-barrel domain protein
MGVAHIYKQNVYDPADNKIGEIMDVLVDRDGKVTALVVGVGGFLGMGEKDVAVPFNSEGRSQKRKRIQVRPHKLLARPPRFTQTFPPTA